MAISAIQLSMTLTKTSPTIMVVSTSDLQRLVKTGADQAARILTWISDDPFVVRAKIDDATGFVTEIVVNESILGLSANDTIEQLLSLRPPRWSSHVPRHRVERLVVVVEEMNIAYALGLKLDDVSLGAAGCKP